MKNGANHTNKIRSDKIQKNGRAELPTEKNAVRQRPEKKSCPKIHKGKKCGPKTWILEPNLKLKDVYFVYFPFFIKDLNFTTP